MSICLGGQPSPPLSLAVKSLGAMVVGEKEEAGLAIGQAMGRTTLTPPKVSSSTASSFSRQALFERSKPFVGVAGLVAVAVDS